MLTIAGGAAAVGVDGRLDLELKALLMNTCEKMVAAALATEGYSANPQGSTQDGYLDLIMPGETDQMRHDALTMSSCALGVRGWMRRADIIHRCLALPYVIREAVEDVLTIGREADALIEGSALDSYVPKAGDVMHVQFPEHVFVLVTVSDLGNGLYDCESIDGGQRDFARCECIARVRRHLTVKAGKHRDLRLDDGLVRDLTAVVDMNAVGEKFGAVGT